MFCQFDHCYPVVIAYKNVNKELEGLVLLKAYDEGTMPPSVVVEIQRPPMPTPPLLIDWYPSSLAKCWAM